MGAVVVVGRRDFEQVLLALALVKIDHVLADVTYVFGAMVLVDETHVLHHAAEDLTCLTTGYTTSACENDDEIILLQSWVNKYLFTRKTYSETSGI